MPHRTARRPTTRWRRNASVWPRRQLEVVILVALTLGGGLDALLRATGALPVAPLLRDVALLAAVALVSGIVGLPFSWWRTFRLEERYGFNRTTLRAVARRYRERRCNRRRARAAACAGRALDNAQRRLGLVAMGLAGVDGVPAAAARCYTQPSSPRSTIKLHTVAGGRGEGARRGAAGTLPLPQRRVCS